MNNKIGCLGWLLGLALLAGLYQCFAGDQDDTDSGGPIPAKYQGAYNSIGCKGSSSHMAGQVTIDGDSVSYDSATFHAKEVVSESDGSITLRGDPATDSGSESSRTLRITHADVGQTASIDGDPYERCSQY